jgi:phosphatidylinositol 4-kinase
MLLLSEEVDRIRGSFYTELRTGIVNKHSLAGKRVSHAQFTDILREFESNGLSPALAFYFVKSLEHSLSHDLQGLRNCYDKVAELLNTKHKNYLNCAHLLDLFIEKNIADTALRKQIFYWKSPHIQVLLKFIGKKYEEQPLLQLFFTKTM